MMVVVVHLSVSTVFDDSIASFIVPSDWQMVCACERSAMLFTSDDNADDDDDDLFAVMSKSSKTAKSVSGFLVVLSIYRLLF